MRTAWQLDVRVDGLQHGIQRLAAHRAIEERRVEEVRQPTAGHTSSSRVPAMPFKPAASVDGMIVPRLSGPSWKAASRKLAVRLRHQGAPARHRHGLGVPSGKIIGKSILPVSVSYSRPQACRPFTFEIGGQRLHLRTSSDAGPSWRSRFTAVLGIL